MKTLINVVTGMWLREKDEKLPHDSQARSLILEGENYATQGNLEKALQCYLQSLELEKCATIYMHVALIYYYKKENKNTEHYFKQALLLAPTSDTIRYNYAHFLHMQGKLDQAQQQFEMLIKKIIELEKDLIPMVLNDLGCIHAHHEHLAKALVLFSQANSIRGQLVVPWYNSGVIYAWQKEFKKALEVFNGVIKKEPSFAFAYNGTGYVYDQQGKKLGAHELFEKALVVDKDCVIARMNLDRIKNSRDNALNEEDGYGIA